jgi:hypothetical protein
MSSSGFGCKNCNSSNVEKRGDDFFCLDCETLNVRLEGEIGFFYSPEIVEDPQYNKPVILDDYTKELVEIEKAKLKELKAIKKELGKLVKIFSK